MANRTSQSSFDDYYTQQSPAQSHTRHSSLARISAVPSFSSFRENTPPVVGGKSPVRRKPLPENASPRLPSFSYSTHHSNGDVTERPYSFESQPPPPHEPTVGSPFSIDVPFILEDLDQSVHDRFRSEHYGSVVADHKGDRPTTQGNDMHLPTHARGSISFDNHPPTGEHVVSYLPEDGDTKPSQQRTSVASTLDHDRNNACNGEQRRVGRPLLSRGASEHSSSTRSKSRSPTPVPYLQTPDMAVLQHGGLPRSVSDNSLESNSSPSKRNKSPTSKFSSFFGWKSSSPKPDGVNSPTTTFSDHSVSPSSPMFAKRMPLDRSASAPRLTPYSIDVDKANSPQAYFENSITPFTARSSTSHSNVQYDDLERELKDVSAELAGSIRREMELEDELDRCKIDVPAGAGESLTRRTSDYFSDSGASSKYPIIDFEGKLEELEKAKRRLEQERAQIKADYSVKLADELRKRREMEMQVVQLEKELQQKQSSRGTQSDDRVRELEMFLEESRRRLSEERQSRDNFQDLLAALRSELTLNAAERDNLRDEIVPQLKARIDGLEAEAAEVSTLRYENTRMQQELAALRGDGPETPIRSRVSSVYDDVGDLPPSAWSRMGLGRSSSSLNRKPSTSTLRRNGSVKNRPEENVSVQHVKDVEDQRDALHHALKNLIRRHETQKREHAKAIQKLIVDRSPARPGSIGRSHYTREVASLKGEIATLRRRADDALEQKWQLENTFGGVKLALDRAQQETHSLRSLLASNDQSAQNALGISVPDDVEVTDASSMIKVLRRSIRLAQTERENALREARAYRERADSLPETEAEKLLHSADRMESLAAELEKHLEANINLRERLAQAVGKGEKEQSVSTQRVVEMQAKLRAMEESVIAAQQQSETTLDEHDETARSLAYSSTPQVQRLQLTIPGTTVGGSRSPSLISPRIEQTSSGRAESLFENSKTAVLQNRVNDLEQALADADVEMKAVVSKIELSQYEIAELQGER